MTVIYQNKNYRITETYHMDISLEDLKGDCFNPAVNPGISIEQLAKEEELFERKVQDEGVFFYTLEQWIPDVGQGWTCLDSCGGFVGPHATEGHDIVSEFIAIIKDELNK